MDWIGQRALRLLSHFSEMIGIQHGCRPRHKRAEWLKRPTFLTVGGVIAAHAGIGFVIARQSIVQTFQPIQLQQAITVALVPSAPRSTMAAPPLRAQSLTQTKTQPHSVSDSRVVDRAVAPARAMAPASERPLTETDTDTDLSPILTTERNTSNDAELAPIVTTSAQQADRPKSVQRIECAMVQPAYPALSRQREEQGTAQIRIVVGIHGQVEQVTLQKSSGFDRLDQAALQAAQNSSCRPYRENGMPVRATTDVPFKFNLQD